MQLPVTLSLITGLLSPSVAPHIRADMQLAVSMQPSQQYGLVQLGDLGHQSLGGQPAARLRAAEGCCRMLQRGGHHLPVTNMPEGQLSKRQFKFKCLPKAMLPDVL